MGEDLASSLLRLKRYINQANGVRAEEHRVQIPGLAECDREWVRWK